MKKPHLFTISSQTINIIKHTIMNFEFKYKEWLEGILLDDAHGLFDKPPNEILDESLPSLSGMGIGCVRARVFPCEPIFRKPAGEVYLCSNWSDVYLILRLAPI